jgi:hypothetical protein
MEDLRDIDGNYFERNITHEHLLPTPDGSVNVRTTLLEKFVDRMNDHNNSDSDEENIHSLGTSFWDHVKDGASPHRDNENHYDRVCPSSSPAPSTSSSRRKITTVLTPTSPIRGLFGTITSPSSEREDPSSSRQQHTNQLVSSIQKFNLHQVISSGRLMDRDALRSSQIEQNEKHQQRQRGRKNVRQQLFNKTKHFLQ